MTTKQLLNCGDSKMFDFLKREKPVKIDNKPRIEYVMLKLSNGEQLVSKMLFTGLKPTMVNDSSYRLIEPTLLIFIPNNNGTLEAYIDKWITFSSSKIYDINKNHIYTISHPSKDIINLYLNYFKPINTKIHNISPKQPKDINTILEHIITTPYCDYGYGCECDME